MVYVKTAIVTTLVLICALLAFMFYTFDADYQLHSSMEAYLREEFDDSKQMLTGLDGVIKPSQINLCRAYIAREEGEWGESDRYLDLAEEHVKRGNSGRILEISLNQVYNAALQEDWARFEQALNQAQKLSPQDSYVQLFEGLRAYQERRFDDALTLWDEGPALSPLSEWMKKGFQPVSQASWKAVRRARCLIAAGEHTKARNLLEDKVVSLSKEELLDSWFLLGFSYLIESQDRPIESASSYYQLALDYFDRVPVQYDHFAAEKAEVIRILQSVGSEMITKEMWEELSTVAQALVNWNAEEEVHALGMQLLKRAEGELEEGEWGGVKKILALLSRFLPTEEFKEPLVRRLELMTERALAEGDTVVLPGYWEMARHLHDDPDQLAKKMASKLRQDILAVLEEDDETLSNASPKLFFWDIVERNAKRRIQFAETLLDYAGALWMEQEEKAKAFHLMQTAAALPFMTEQQTFNQQVGRVLRALYRSAVTEDQVDDLPRIFEAARYFHLQPADLQNKTETANLVADADYLFEQGRYREAEKRLNLVLKIHPDNPGALRVRGLIYMHLGQPEEALSILKGVGTTDRAVQEALAVCEILAGDHYLGSHLLNRLEEEKPLSKDVNLILAFGALLSGDGALAESRLKLVREPDGSIAAALCYASYLEENWEETAQRFRGLSFPYSAVPGLQLAAVQSFARVGRPEMAERLLQQLLEKKGQPLPEFPSHFAVLKEKRLDAWDAELIAGLFYFEVANDPKTALEHLQRVSKDSEQLLLARGRVQAALGRFEVAREDLEKLHGSSDRSIREAALVATAVLYAERTWDHTAIELADRALSMDPRNEEALVLLADIYKRRGRWDLALKQLNVLQKKRGLTSEEKVFFTQALFHLGQHQEVERRLRTWLTFEEGISFESQIRLSTIALRLDKQEVASGLAVRIRDKKFSDSERLALMEFYLEKGDYGKASELAPNLSSDQRDSVEGKMLFAELNWRLSNDEEANVLVRTLHGVDVGSREAWTFGFLHDHNSNVLAKRLEKLEQAIEKQPEELTLKLSLYRDQLNYAQARRAAKGELDKDYESMLEEVREGLQRLHEQSKRYPETYMLMGTVLHLQGNTNAAEDALLHALKLDPSQKAVHLRLSQLYDEEDRQMEAGEQLRSVLEFYPRDPRIWLAMGEHFKEEGDLMEAKTCYQTVVELRPNDSLVYFTLGKLLMELKNPEDAHPALSKAVQLSPGHADSLELLLECLYDETFVARRAMNERDGLVAEREDTYHKLEIVSPSRAINVMQRFQQSSVE